MIKKVDKKNRYIAIFDPKTGFYMRTGVIGPDGVDTGVDPFMSSFPELIDIGIMGSCKFGQLGLCVAGGTECYQNGMNTHGDNMTLENFKKIIDECKGKTFQVALGGRGDVDQHENFEEILAYCRENQIVPNFTSSGLGFTKEIVEICKKYTGAIAISWYRQKTTTRAINMLLDAGVKTNIHYVLGNNTIDEAIDKLKNDSFPRGINAVVFLLHKHVGMGSQENVLKADDPKVKEFFSLIDNNTFSHKIGLDSCSVPGLINFNENIDRNSMDTCEGARYSMYIAADMTAMPCSFDNQDLKWGMDLNKHTIQEVWDSKEFDSFRSHFTDNCKGCSEHESCRSGCPIVNEITLCNRPERDIK